jgi:nucleotidyltransferase/DNA polymerase involved in DNA repair
MSFSDTLLEELRLLSHIAKVRNLTLQFLRHYFGTTTDDRHHRHELGLRVPRVLGEAESKVDKGLTVCSHVF